MLHLHSILYFCSKEIDMRLLLFLFPFILFACSPDQQDNSAPNLNLAESNFILQTAEVCDGTSDHVIRANGGDILQLSLNLTDDLALSELKVELHENFDCHGHGEEGDDHSGEHDISFPTTNPSTSVFEKNIILTLEGNDLLQELSIPIPENISAGLYHFQIKLLDESGNEATPLIYDLLLTNPLDKDAPEIELNSPSGDPVDLQTNDSLTIEGQITDNRPLFEGGNGFVLIYLIDEEGHASDLRYEHVFTQDDGNSFPLNVTFPMSGLMPESYHVEIIVRDGVRNTSDIEFELNLTN